MVKVRQVTFMKSEITDRESEVMEVDTWIDLSQVVFIEDIRPFGFEWHKGRDFTIYFKNGCNIHCAGEPQDLIDKFNKTLVPFTLN